MALNTIIYGASGYTGAELLRLLAGHPEVRIHALTADSNAGRSVGDLFPHLSALDLPTLSTIADTDVTDADVLFCALPHGTTQRAIAAALEAKPTLKVVDLSADFRLRDADAYAHWYGHEHLALPLQDEAVYGITELYRDGVEGARLVANPGCHPATSLLALVPLVSAGVVEPDTITVTSATGTSGAGRGAKVGMLFSEISEGAHAYGVGRHRHTAEFDQELSKAAGHDVRVTFTPLLCPMNRGIYATITARGDAAAMHKVLIDAYADEAFVEVLPLGEAPQSRHVRGSNLARIGVVPDRTPGKAVILATTDNLMKGASSQAVQNMNAMCGLPETMAVPRLAVFP
ncbi:MAG: N-acetyl-gamma-glutamyl-phosphate reductase [Pseudomonadota bacterium]